MDNKLNKNLKTKIKHQPQPKNTNILRINYQNKIIQKIFQFPGETFVFFGPLFDFQTQT